ncbi:MAG TPA: hypothetical protein VFQ05_03960 [Candidatus Eisenbacteria bacterium]|nr:hypothetical protein [Candidatus Eisenbacteria bacterium]
MRKQGTMLMALAAMVAFVAAAEAGGRARVELSQAPRQVTAGKSFDLAIKVVPESWSHKRNIEPLVVAQCGDLKVTSSAVALAQTNHYRASLKLPSAGAWKVRVDSRYCETVMKPVEIQALAAVAKR